MSTPLTPPRSTADTIARQSTKPSSGIQYVDRADCEETFADTVTSVSFDGQTLRVEFGVTRMDETKKGASPTGRRYPVCRLVLPPAAAVDLINKMQQTAAAMQQAGLLKANREGPAGP